MTDRNMPDAKTQPGAAPYSRRRFLATAGALAGAGMISLQSCSKDDSSPYTIDEGINLGSGDNGLLNYFYVLKQQTAAFYKQVSETPYAGATTLEKQLLTDMAAHEDLHMRYLKQLVSSRSGVIENPGTNFSTIAFSDRNKVLTVARTLEDLGIAAYNGAAHLFTEPSLLTAAGKMASVTARHASVIRDILVPGSFAALGSLGNFGALSASGLDAALPPAAVLDQLGKYFAKRINASNLPVN